MKESLLLTENELEIVNLLWECGRALSRSEIIKLLPNKSWSNSSIHIILNKLLEKEAIKVDGFVKTGKNYGRTYSAAITREEYRLIQVRRATKPFKGEKLNLPSIFSTLVQDEKIDGNTILELEAILEQKRKEIAEDN